MVSCTKTGSYKQDVCEESAEGNVWNCEAGRNKSMYTENLHNFYSSPNKVELSNWEGLYKKEEKKCVQSGESIKRVKCFADLDVNGRIKLNSNLKTKKTWNALD